MPNEKPHSTRSSHPLSSFVDSALVAHPMLLQLLVDVTSEIVKFYSSVYRVHNYPTTGGKPERRASGKSRLMRRFSTPEKENPLNPKFCREAYERLTNVVLLWANFQSQVLKNDLVERGQALFEGTPDDYWFDNKTEPTFLRVLHNIEGSWLFHRAYAKIFNDYHTEPKNFLDLEALLLTHAYQFFMRELLHYLEGNYVVSVRGTGKVYIPHLQADRYSVDLPYTSFYGIGNTQVVGDYFTKSNVKDTNELLANFEQMWKFEADFIGGKRQKLFLGCSQYVDRVRYVEMFREWLRIIGDNLPPERFNDRETVIATINELVDNRKLTLPTDLYIEEEGIGGFIENYVDDRFIFSEIMPTSAVRRLLRTVFVSLIEYSINRYRMASRGGAGSDAERTEYETVFRAYRNMTLLEQRMNCLLVEDGEISFILLLANYFKSKNTVPSIDQLRLWGLIEFGKHPATYAWSPRGRRMVRWVAKVAGWNLVPDTPGEQSLRYADNRDLREHYETLVADADSLFHWLKTVPSITRLRDMLYAVAFSESATMASSEILRCIRAICESCLDASNPNYKATVDCITIKSRFNQDLNEFLRTNETINRSVVAVPISTIPSELIGLGEKIFGFSIFIGTFCFPDGLDDDERFSEEISALELILQAAKTYFTLIGKPASEALNHYVVEELSSRLVTQALGKSSHTLKNAAVSFRAQIDLLKRTLKQETHSEPVRARLQEFDRNYEKLSGAIQVLNLASNPFQAKYLDERRYCLLDTILSTYCDAVEQFYVQGPKREIKQMWSDTGQYYRVPLLKLTVTNKSNAGNYSIESELRYVPGIADMSFEHPNTVKFDAEDVLSSEQIFEDLLPGRQMLATAFLEIFTNALVYADKSTEQVLLELGLAHSDHEIVIRIANTTSKTNLQRLFQPAKGVEALYKERGAGVETNELFFKNIGGKYTFEPDHKSRRVVTTAHIDLQFLRSFEQGGSHEASADN